LTSSSARAPLPLGSSPVSLRQDQELFPPSSDPEKAAKRAGSSDVPQGDVSVISTDQASVIDQAGVPDSAGSVSRPRRRARRRELRCPLHPEQKIFSVSPKHHLYVTDVGQLMLRGLSKRRADELLAAYRRVLPLTDEWIECFWCDDCACTSWWHVKRHDRHNYSLNKVPRELWEQATGVIRVEGNPTVSQFSRRQARATGVLGMRQYRFL
jgi:hypothetical protein